VRSHQSPTSEATIAVATEPLIPSVEEAYTAEKGERMRRFQNALIGAMVISVLLVAGSLAISRTGKAQVPVSAVAVYGPPASTIVEILCTDNSGLLYPGNSCTSVLPDGRRGSVYTVPAQMNLVITSVHMEGHVYRTDGNTVHEVFSIGSPGPNGIVYRADWTVVGGTNVYQYPAGIVLPPGYAPNGYGMQGPLDKIILRGYLSAN
jgi:hypothetical protein